MDSRRPLGAKEPRSTGRFIPMASFTGKPQKRARGPENGLYGPPSK